MDEQSKPRNNERRFWRLTLVDSKQFKRQILFNGDMPPLDYRVPIQCPITGASYSYSSPDLLKERPPTKVALFRLRDFNYELLSATYVEV
jgi:hypothetical protein